MKFAIVFLCACVVISHQQFQTQKAVFWLSPYSSSPLSAAKSYPAYRYNDIPYLNAELNRENFESYDNLEDIQHQSRIRGSFGQEQVNPRFFFRPSGGSSAVVPTIMSLVTTIASVVSCVPNFQFLALGVPAPPPCVGRKRREVGHMASEDIQFPILPTATLQLTPTHLPRENRQVSADKSVGDILLPTMDDVTHGEVSHADQMTSRDKRFFFSNGIFSNGILGNGLLGNGLAGSSAMAAVSAVTSYAFVGVTLTQTVNLVVPAPAAQCDPAAVAPALPTPCATCLPAGYIVCPA